MNPDEFEDALIEHLAALQARDVERFAATLGDDVTVVDGRGAVTSGREAVLHSHAEWFASPDAWSFDYAVRLSRDCGTAAFALIDVTYQQTADAEPARFLLSLFFEREPGGAWKFVYDQNTPLAA
jgi:uncharacterized protein (TIGR02246 family)